MLLSHGHYLSEHRKCKSHKYADNARKEEVQYKEREKGGREERGMYPWKVPARTR